MHFTRRQAPYLPCVYYILYTTLFPNVRVNMRGVSVLGLVGAVLLATALAQSR